MGRRADRVCAVCGEPVVYYSKVKRKRRWSPDHDLCQACWDRQRDRMQDRHHRWMRTLETERHYEALNLNTGETQTEMRQNDILFTLTGGTRLDRLEVGDTQERRSLIDPEIAYIILRVR